jgi:addiction module RelB/DinJ family antitoxin
MSDTTTVTIRTKKSLKKDAQELFNELGISFSGAVNLRLNDLVKNKTINFSFTYDDSEELHEITYDELSDIQKKKYDALDTRD